MFKLKLRETIIQSQVNLPNCSVRRCNSKNAQFSTRLQHSYSSFHRWGKSTAVYDQIETSTALLLLLQFIGREALVPKIWKTLSLLRSSLHWRIEVVPSLWTKFLRMSFGSDTVTLRCPWRWRHTNHKFPIMPAPITRMLWPTVTGEILSQPWARQDSGSHKAPRRNKF